jgi:putative PEP-CTERM system TPR-repeat lipoprotein
MKRYLNASLVAPWLLLTAGCFNQSTESLLQAASAWLSRKDVAATIIHLKSAIQQDPESGEARFRFGKVLLQGGDPVSAAVELRKARALNTPDDKVLPPLARALLAQGQAKELIDEFGGANLTDPVSVADFKTSLATAYAGRGMFPQAEAALQAALLAKPDHAEAQLLQIRMLARSKGIDGVLTMMTKLLEQHPDTANVWKAQGGLLMYGKGDLAGAFDAFRKAIALDPQDVETHAGAIAILVRRSDPASIEKQLAELRKVAPNHPQTRYFEAQLAFKRRDFERARALLQDLLRNAPDDARVLQLAGAAELEVGSLVQAQAYLQKALQSTGDQPMTRQLLAQAYLRAGQPAKVLEVLKPVIDGKPDAVTLSLAAQARLMNGDARESEQLYAQAAKLNPHDTASRTALAVALIGRGKVDSGFQELEKLAASDGGTTADLALISAHLARREFAAALKAVDALEKKAPNKPFAVALRGRAQLLSGDTKAARQSFERALVLDAAFYPAISGLAALDVTEKKPQDARKRLQAVVDRDPKNVQALVALAELIPRTGGSKGDVAQLLDSAVKLNPTDPAARARLVDHHLRWKEPQLALTAAQAGVAAAPTNPEMLELLGRAQMGAGEPQQALGTFSRRIALPPETAQIHLQMGEAQLATRSLAAARQSLKRALALAPDLLPAHQKLAALEIADGRPNEALAIAREIQKQRPKDSVGFTLEAEAENSRKNANAAIAAYRTALKLNPKPEIAVNLHATLAATGKTADASRFATEWLNEHPADALFRFHLGDIAFRQNDLPLAESRYREVLKLTPDNYLALNNVAWVMTLQGKRGAVPYAQKASELQPSQPAVLGTLASALANEGQFDRAIELQQKVVEMQPKAPLFRLNLARIYIKANRKSQAETELESLAKLGDQFAGQPEVAQLLKTLKGG